MKDTASYFKDYFQNMSAFYQSFDYSKIMPNFDKHVNSSQENMKEWFDLNHLMSEKTQSILKKQSEILQDNTSALLKAIKDISQNSLDPEELIEKQNEFTRQNMTRNMQHSTELCALYTQAGSEIFRKYSEQMQNQTNTCYDINASRSSQDSTKKK